MAFDDEQLFICKVYQEKKCPITNCILSVPHLKNWRCEHSYCAKIDRCNGGCVEYVKN